MTGAPHFDFTSRAVPVIQMGRAEHRVLGNDLWGTGRWGVAKWGARDWEPIWSDLTCEVHEVTTNTGRGGATDRFVPGTAEIVASNMNQVSELIFPAVPDTGEGFEYVEQPPITHEEELQAPGAATVTSTGWSFVDDFERIPPQWVFPSAFAEAGTFPTRPIVWGERFVAPEMYADSTFTYEAHGVMQWTHRYPTTDNLGVELLIPDLSWAEAPLSGTPRLVVDLYYGMGTADRTCNVARFTFTPNFAGANGVTIVILRQAADGSTVAGSSSPTYSTTIGTDGDFGALTIGAVFARRASQSGPPANSIRATVNDRSTQYGIATWATGGRIGFAVDYVQGEQDSLTIPEPPHVTAFLGPDFDDLFERPPGAGWVVNPRLRYLDAMIVEDGAMRPPVRFDVDQAAYLADGSAQWTSEFNGDQVIEIELTGVSMPELDGISETRVELYAKGNRDDLACVVAIISYLPGFGGGLIDWVVGQYGPNGETAIWPIADGITVDEWGDFPEPAVWRLEADTVGDVRIYYQGDLVGSTVLANIPDGGRIGVKVSWGAGGAPPGTIRPTVPRIERLAAGLREPLGTEELGMWVRIGVDHATLGEHWFFRGFVDAIVPTYHPEHSDAVRIECIDSLGEAGRVFVDGGRLAHRFAEAATRIRQILNAAHWPDGKRQIRDDATSLSRPPQGRAVDLLTQCAESCGGAVYGDPDTGDIVFKGQDWQGVFASQDPQAFITNYRPDFVVDDLPRVCPSQWERSSRRTDMVTRVRYSSETSDTPEQQPIVKEWRGPNAERMYGVELYERTLLCITGERLNELAIRQLRLRHPNQFPRVEAVVLDAATADEALDLMTQATFTRPSKYWCQLQRDGEFVFNRKYLVTGVRHRMTPKQWSCRLALDPSSVFYETGGRWGKARWGRDVWGNTR